MTDLHLWAEIKVLWHQNLNTAGLCWETSLKDLLKYHTPKMNDPCRLLTILLYYDQSSLVVLLLLRRKYLVKDCLRQYRGVVRNFNWGVQDSFSVAMNLNQLVQISFETCFLRRWMGAIRHFSKSMSAIGPIDPP